MSEQGAGPAPATRRWRGAVFVVLMLALTALFVALGIWQWQRMGEKQALIDAVADRMDRAPAALPAPGQWPALDPDFYDYRPLTVSGRYVPEATVLVFTSLASPKGRLGGPGYWVMTPFVLADGGTIFVNRGFVPQPSGPAFARGGAIAPGTITLAGIGRASEEAGAFTPVADSAKRTDWVRNIDRLARLADPSLAPFAPIYLDLPAGESGALPQGGETVVEFPNNHLGYAITWFGFALLTPVLLVFWLRRRRPREP